MEITKLIQISSLEIAKITGKEHKNVLVDIRNILTELELNSAQFSAQYKDSSGKTNPMFILPKREALILASGYSIKLRAKLIDELEKLTNKKADIAWQEARKLTKDNYAPMSEALRLKREEEGKETKPFHYSNEASLICKVLTGLTPKKYRELYAVGAVREALTKDELVWLNRLQSMNTGLIAIGQDYDERKSFLTQYYIKHKDRLKIVRGGEQLALIEAS